jgi:replicative DNA helicase
LKSRGLVKERKSMDENTKKAEWQVIGCLLMTCFRKEIQGKDFTQGIFNILKPEQMSGDNTHRFYTAMQGCFKQYGTTEKLTLIKYMQEKKTYKNLDEDILDSAIQNCGFTLDAEYYAKCVRDYYLKRMVNECAGKGDYEGAKKILNQAKINSVEI